MSKYDWNLERIKEAVKTSINYSEVLDKLGIPRQGRNTETLKKKISEGKIDISHFTGRARQYRTRPTNIQNYLNNSISISSGKLKEKLLKEGLKENRCEICGLTEWQGKPIVLQLHHIDGNHKNNNLSNLQILCPNCHSQTENYCGNSAKKEHYYCPDCGKEIHKGSKYCTVCARKHTRRIDRPSKEQLLKDFQELMSLSNVGRKYGVTDNSIRKWLKSYNLPCLTKQLKLYLNI